jgi:hypothetical protein
MKAIRILLKIVLPIGAVLILIVGTIISTSNKASAQQPAKTVVTQISINMYFPAPGEPWDYNVAQDLERINNTAGLYNISIDYWYKDQGATEFLDHGFIPTATTQLQTMIRITAIGQNTYFDENINILINGSGLNMFPATAHSLRVTDHAITIGGHDYIQETNPARLRPSGSPQPPIYHTTGDPAIIPTPELPDMTEFSEVILYAADLIMRAQSIQNAGLVETLEEQTEQINKTVQHNFNMIIVFSLVIIGAIIGIGFLVAWRPTHD